ncbi:MAG: hypothetical protein CMF50_08865 [Legionellales bacterium]|nr:hypothetical protein [Legionellales bacterium]|tara:strand:- start:11594 stop:11893 length:300 start_codon:yes stop_codon:yes gene_type:complete
MNIGLLGYGYSAGYLSQQLVREGHQIWGTRRDPAVIQPHDSPAVTLLPFDYNAIIEALTDTSGLLISVPPLADGQDPVFMSTILRLLCVTAYRHYNPVR